MTAIVYCSQTGHTAQYAKLLSQRLQLPAYRMEAAVDAVPKGTEIIFLSWIRAGVPKSWRQASSLWRIQAMGVVGMTTAGDVQLPRLAQRCGLSDTFPLFYLPGGYTPQSLPAGSRLLLNIMGRQQIRALSAKASRTPAEQEALLLWQDGGDLVDVRHLAALAAWCQQQLPGNPIL